MSRRLRWTAALLIFGLPTVVPTHALPAGGALPQVAAPEPIRWLDAVWSWLTAHLAPAGARQDAGWEMDPDGTTGDAGWIMDPEGATTGDEGWTMDPDG